MYTYNFQQEQGKEMGKLEGEEHERNSNLNVTK